MKDKLLAFLMKGMRTEVAAAGVIRKGNKILLSKRANMLPEGGKWSLPGGHVNKWEKAEDCVRREIKEELGLEVKKSKLLFVHEEFVKRIGLHAIVFVYNVETSGELRTNLEVSETKWFDKKQIDKMDLAFTHSEIIKKYSVGRKK